MQLSRLLRVSLLREGGDHTSEEADEVSPSQVSAPANEFTEADRVGRNRDDKRGRSWPLSGGPLLFAFDHSGVSRVGQDNSTNRGTLREGKRARGGAVPLPRDSSDDAALRQIRDLLLRVADGRQDLLVGLAELRRRAAQRQTLLAVRDRVAEDGELAEHRRAHR